MDHDVNPLSGLFPKKQNILKLTLASLLNLTYLLKIKLTMGRCCKTVDNGSIEAMEPNCLKTLQKWLHWLNILSMGCGGGQVVSVLAYYSDNPSSNPTEAYSFFYKIVFEKNEINKKRPTLDHIFFKKRILCLNAATFRELSTKRTQIRTSKLDHQSFMQNASDEGSKTIIAPPDKLQHQ